MEKEAQLDLSLKSIATTLAERKAVEKLAALRVAIYDAVTACIGSGRMYHAESRQFCDEIIDYVTSHPVPGVRHTGLKWFMDDLQREAEDFVWHRVSDGFFPTQPPQAP